MISTELEQLKSAIIEKCPVFEKIYWRTPRTEFKGTSDSLDYYGYLRYSTDKVDTFSLSNWDEIGCTAKKIKVDLVFVGHFDKCTNKEAVGGLLCKAIDSIYGAEVRTMGIDTELIYQSEEGESMKDDVFELIKVAFTYEVHKTFNCETKLCLEACC